MSEKKDTTILVSDIMVTKLISVKPDDLIYDAVDLLVKNRITGLPVINDQGEFVGILSELDCMKTILQEKYHQRPIGKVSEFMTKPVKHVTENNDVFDLVSIFLNNPFRRLPVMKNGKLIGLVTRHDVMRAIQQMPH